jgi:hypothetical protein
MATNSTFRVLYRQFLFRLMDVEMLASSAQGDTSGLLGQFGALLVFGSVLLSWGAVAVGGEIRRGGSAAGIWGAERFLVSLTMLAVGVFALLNWDAAFPDRSDVLVLSPLPIRGRTLFAAKISAAAVSLGLTVAALNCISAFAWPLSMAPTGFAFPAKLRFVIAFWVALFAAGAFIFCLVLGVQAAAAQLPRRWYLRLSPILQIGGLILFLGVFFFQAAGAGAERWLPPYWFTGLLSELSGVNHARSHPAMAPLAERATAALGIGIVVAGGAFLLSYVRTLRKIVEEPDSAPVSRGGFRLPRFGSQPQTALAHFAIRSLFRSRRHRVILSFYLGGGFALTFVYLAIVMDLAHLSWTGLLREQNVPVMGASYLVLLASWAGTRMVFALPLDLRANWLFRLTPPCAGAASLAAVRRAMLAVTLLPVTAATAAILLGFWNWTALAQHLLVLVLLGSILTDLSLREFRKIPFTCSYLPGKSKVHMVFWFGIIPLVFLVHKLAEIEDGLMDSALGFAAMVAVLIVAAWAARRAANNDAAENHLDVQFEETSSDELLTLGLNG